MTDDLEGPDASALAKLARASMSAEAYRAKYEVWGQFKPSRKQLEFFAGGATAQERLFVAGTQMGKSLATAFEVSCHALNRYPAWWTGKRFERQALSPPMIIWCCAPDQSMLKASWIKRLTGDPTPDDKNVATEYGTGFLPRDSLTGRPQMQRGLSGVIDTVAVRQDNGSTCYIRFKSYAQDRQAYQSESCHVVAWDEAMSDFSLYLEGLSRGNAIPGSISMAAYTPLLGRDQLYVRFEQESPERKLTIMEIDDVMVDVGGHITPEQRKILEKKYEDDPTEADTRLRGIPYMGEGKVIRFPRDQYVTDFSLRDVTPNMRLIRGLDYASGLSDQAHGFAAVLLAWDEFKDIVYVVDSWKMYRALIGQHIERIAVTGLDIVTSWPADMNATAKASIDGVSVAMAYKRAKPAGVDGMRPTWATWPEGGFKTETGAFQINKRMEGGKLLISKDCVGLLAELAVWHRKSGSGIVREFDDEISALRTALADLRYSRHDERQPGVRPKSYSKDRRGIPHRAIGASDSYFGID